MAFARESGNAIGRLDNNQEANLMEWINFRKENPRNLADVEKVINWINQGVITSPNIAKLKNMATQVLDENNYENLRIFYNENCSENSRFLVQSSQQ